MFDQTQDCFYKCDKYFEPLDKPVTMVYAPRENRNLWIAENDQARQLELYVPDQKATKAQVRSELDEMQPQNQRGNETSEDKKPTQIATTEGVMRDKSRTTRIYRKSKRKAKQVTFSQFQKTDPVLKRFREQDEDPKVERAKCPSADPELD